jgi:hypothetical protein
MKRTCICLLAAGALMLGTIGCAATLQPVQYHDERDEKSGPGLFSGAEGGFIIYGETLDKKKKPDSLPSE